VIEIFGIPSTALFGQLLIGLINGSFYALLSLGLAVIFGMLNIINFSHGAQYMLGAFAAYLLEVKKPDESKYPGDFYHVRATIPAEEAFRPLKDGGCPLVSG